jgi:predicted lipid-binding transport protein (Tim44 family)
VTKVFVILTALFFTATVLTPLDSEAARRFGGGRSSGMQRSLPPQTQKAPAAQPDKQVQQAGVPATGGMSRWLGPLAGFGLGALMMSMFGGSAMAGILGNVLMVILAFMVIRFLMGAWQRRNQPDTRGMQYARTPGATSENRHNAEGDIGTFQSAGGQVMMPQLYPAGFNVEGFLRQAKVSFQRLQAANDAGDINDIRDYTTPELYAEIAMQIQERGGAKQRVDVLKLDAELLEVVTEGEREIASVHFSGLIREEENAGAEAFDEVWHVIKDAKDPKGAWIIAGIQVNEP